MEKHWYIYETGSSEVAEALKKHLHDNDIYFECSGMGSGWYFDILATSLEVFETENLLTTLV